MTGSLILLETGDTQFWGGLGIHKRHSLWQEGNSLWAKNLLLSWLPPTGAITQQDSSPTFLAKHLPKDRGNYANKYGNCYHGHFLKPYLEIFKQYEQVTFVSYDLPYWNILTDLNKQVIMEAYNNTTANMIPVGTTQVSVLDT